MPNNNFLNNLEEQKEPENAIVPGRKINKTVYSGRSVAGDVGLELEIEGRAIPTNGNIANVKTASGVMWNSIKDGSLRNGGREFVTTGPIKTSELRQMVGGLFDQFKALGTEVRNTNRCSTHVHVNASDLKVNQVASVIALWCTFQKCLIEWCGEDRAQNHFCLSSREEEGMVEAWLDYCQEGNIPGRGGYRGGIKYTALNILPLWEQGSLEFRCGGAPDEPNKIIYWAKICNAIVRYAAEYYSNPNNLSYAMSEQGPAEILRAVLDYADLGPKTTDRIYQELTANGRLEIDAMNDFRDVQAIIHLFPWDDIIEKISKPVIDNPFESKEVYTTEPFAPRLRPINFRPDGVDRLVADLLNDEDDDD